VFAVDGPGSMNRSPGDGEPTGAAARAVPASDVS